MGGSLEIRSRQHGTEVEALGRFRRVQKMQSRFEGYLRLGFIALDLFDVRCGERDLAEGNREVRLDLDEFGAHLLLLLLKEFALPLEIRGDGCHLRSIGHSSLHRNARRGPQDNSKLSIAHRGIVQARHPES